MKLLLKLFAVFVLLIATLSSLGYFFWYKPKFTSAFNSNSFAIKNNVDKAILTETLKQKAALLETTLNSGQFNTEHCFLIDMRIASGQNRFFIYNLNKDSVEMAGLVAHGSGSEKGGDELYFSNTPNSNCTSLGKYKIGKSYMGRFGLAYKLYGLDDSNSKAFERFVVLHAHRCVPVGETAPVPICESLGCPTVAPAFLIELKKYIDNAAKPILMYIYY